MRAGKLDRLITIQAFTAAQNDYGEPVETWTTLADVWAERISVSGNEAFTADQIAAITLSKYRIRYRTDVTEKCRIVDGANTLNIRYVSEIGRRDGLELVAEAINP